MKRINLFISDEDFEYLKSKQGTLSEHIRFAIAQYIHRLRQEETRLTQVSASASGKKGGEQDG